MTQKYTVTSGTLLSISRARSRISGFLGIANTVHGRAWTQPDYPTPPCRARPPGLLRVAVDPVRRERQDGPRAVVWRPGDEPSWGPIGGLQRCADRVSAGQRFETEELACRPGSVPGGLAAD